MIFKVWRVKRLRLFAETLGPTSDQKLLDVGGYPWFWTSTHPLVGTIDCINLDDQQWNTESFPNHHIRCLTGDGCELEFSDQSYDIAFSNSVIEHVGSWENQMAFAREIRRVGISIWVQTPAFECPIEPHYLAPCIHWFPKEFRRKTLRFLTPWGWIAKPSKDLVDAMVDGIRLLTKKEMVILFPDCTILTERICGVIPKSYIAVRNRAPISG